MSDEWSQVGKDAKEEAFPGGGDLAPRPRELRIAFEKRPYADMIGHAVQEPEVELCGVLVGHVRRDRYGPWLHVTDSIRGEKANQKNAQVTFTHDTWNHIHAELDRRPECKILGWYHTHGGFGIFLSEMDTFIHENFFSEPYHFAYVYDPLAGTEGFFFRHGREYHQATRYWVGGKPREVLGARPEPVRAEAAADPGAPAGGPALAALGRQLAQLQVAVGEREPGLSLLPFVLGMLLLAAVISWNVDASVRAHARRERVLVKLITDPAGGQAYGVELVPLPLPRAELGAGLVVYQDTRGGQFFAADLVPVSSAAVLLEQQVAATLDARRALARSPAAAAGAGGASGGPEVRDDGGPNLLVVGLVMALVVGVFVGAGVLVKRRTGGKAA